MVKFLCIWILSKRREVEVEIGKEVGLDRYSAILLFPPPEGGEILFNCD